MRKNSRWALGLSSLLVAGLTLTACGGGEDEAEGDYPEPVASIDVGVAPDFFFTHLYLAVEKGFFAEQGIEATLTEYPSGGEATEAICESLRGWSGTGWSDGPVVLTGV